MTRMIERWFPCAEVSAGSGSGNAERNLFIWFASRPTAQARAAVICSLLPWPDEGKRQKELQDLVRDAMAGGYAGWKRLRAEIVAANGQNAAVLDPFSGRGIIPLEAARLDLPAHAIDYSPVAVLASRLLTDYPFRDWSSEPALPFAPQRRALDADAPRLLHDVGGVLKEIERRFRAALDDFYPASNGKRPWGYLWAVTLPCQECGRRFPLVGSYALRRPCAKKGRNGKPDWHDPGQSFQIVADATAEKFQAVVADGPPSGSPTLASPVGRDGRKARGKSAICPFCGHAHPLPVHKRLASEGLGRDALLVVSDIDATYGKTYRAPTPEEVEAAARATRALAAEPAFTRALPAIPDERIPLNNGSTIRPQLYGARTYGDMMCDRQTLSFVRLSRIIADLGSELRSRYGVTNDYARALTGYAAAVLGRKVRRATRGCTLDTSRAGVHDLFVNESTIAFSYDYLEPGIGEGPGTWSSLSASTLATLRSLLAGLKGRPAAVVQGSAADVPHSDNSMAVVVTDPPYDSLVYYTDLSDLFYAWFKRALHTTWPEMALTLDPRGLQDKTDEILVKEHGKSPGEHRDRAHYDTRIAKAFSEMRRVVRDDGLVTIVFGHGEPEVWRRLFGAIQKAGLVITASWPANTESGGHQGKANIETTLTMACRPATAGRPEGRKAAVEAEIKAEIRRRHPDWERWGFAPADMLMAASGLALKVVGRHSVVLDARAEPVDIFTFLPLARAAVQEAMGGG